MIRTLIADDDALLRAALRRLRAPAIRGCLATVLVLEHQKKNPATCRLPDRKGLHRQPKG